MTGLKLNSQLARYIRDHPSVLKAREADPALSYQPRKWRLRDKLSKRDIARLIVAFKAGTATSTLATRYHINVKSVRKLLREHCDAAHGGER